MEPITALTPILLNIIQQGAQLERDRIQVADRMDDRRIRLRALESRLDHELEMAQIQAQTTRDLLHSLVDRRVDAIMAAFFAVLAIYAEQGRDCLQQRSKYVDANIVAKDLDEKRGLLSAIAEADNQLREIRRDARSLYREMTRTIASIGGTMPPLAGNMQHALALEERKIR